MPEQVETKVFIIEFNPTDDFLRAINAINPKTLEIIIAELKNRRDRLGIGSCTIVNKRYTGWVQGRVQELNDILAAIISAKEKMIERQRAELVAAQASKAM